MHKIAQYAIIAGVAIVAIGISIALMFYPVTSRSVNESTAVIPLQFSVQPEQESLQLNVGESNIVSFMADNKEPAALQYQVQIFAAPLSSESKPDPRFIVKSVEPMEIPAAANNTKLDLTVDVDHGVSPGQYYLHFEVFSEEISAGWYFPIEVRS